MGRNWRHIPSSFLASALNFILRKLAQVGINAVITAVIEMSLMMTMGFALGQLLGFTPINSIFLGGLVSISSTSIILRSVGDLGIKGRRFINNVYGILIIEDILAVLLLVLLSTISISQKCLGGAF